MPQARLPDINTSFTKHRNEVMGSLKSQNYDAAYGSLYALNALLPDTADDSGRPKYRVVISDMEYKEKTKPETTVYCGKCGDSFLYEEIHIFNARLSSFDILLSGKISKKSWKCRNPDCPKINRLEQTRIVEKKFKEPYYFGVVPQPPHVKEGLTNRVNYDKKVTQWVLTFLTELEGKMAQFRDDNWTKDQEAQEGNDLTFENAGETE